MQQYWESWLKKKKKKKNNVKGFKVLKKKSFK